MVSMVTPNNTLVSLLCRHNFSYIQEDTISLLPNTSQIPQLAQLVTIIYYNDVFNHICVN